MATRTLSRDALAFGRAALLATDTLGMKPEGAFWICDSKDNEWRYFIVTSMLERVGPRDLFSVLNKAFARKLSEKETENFRFYISGPDERIIRALRKHVHTHASSSDPMAFSFTFKDRPISGFVYRLASKMDEQSAKKAQRRFRQESHELAVA